MAVEKTRNSGRWTESRFHSFVKGALRYASQKWGPRFDALKAAEVGVKINKKTGRKAKHYKCAMCGVEATSTGIAVDHIEPVIDPAVGFVSWDSVVERLFCEADKLQVLCHSCHKKVTDEEKAIAKARRAKEKDASK